MSEPSLLLHQQDGGMSLRSFAEREELIPAQALHCVKAGKVLGARKTHGSHWVIYPPAKLLSRPRTYEKRQKEPKRPAALSDLLAGVDAVAVEARTESRQSGQASPRVEAEGSLPQQQTGFPRLTASAGTCRTLALASSEVPYPVVLSGRQVLLLDRALSSYLERFETEDSQDDFDIESQPRGCPDAEVVATIFSALRNVGRNRVCPQGKVWPEFTLGSQP